MTREEAIHKLKYLFFNAKALPNTEEALEMTIKALEQESVLDKIKIEVEAMAQQTPQPMPFDSMDKAIYTKGFVDGLMSAVDCIDKYKAESEDKNGI